MPIIHIFNCIVILIVWVRFVDGIVCEVDIEVAEITCLRKFVLLGGETDKTLVVEIYSKRIDASQQNIDSQIKLESSIKERV